MKVLWNIDFNQRTLFVLIVLINAWLLEIEIGEGVSSF